MKDDTVVCECTQTTIQDMKDAIANGVDTYEQFQAQTKISTECHGCQDVTLPLFHSVLPRT